MLAVDTAVAAFVFAVLAVDTAVAAVDAADSAVAFAVSAVLFAVFAVLLAVFAVEFAVLAVDTALAAVLAAPFAIFFASFAISLVAVFSSTAVMSFTRFVIAPPDIEKEYNGNSYTLFSDSAVRWYVSSCVRAIDASDAPVLATSVQFSASSGWYVSIRASM